MWGPSWKALNMVGLPNKLRIPSKAIIIPSLPIRFCFSHLRVWKCIRHGAIRQDPKRISSIKLAIWLPAWEVKILGGTSKKNVKTDSTFQTESRTTPKYSNYLYIWGAFFRFIRVRSVGLWSPVDTSINGTCSYILAYSYLAYGYVWLLFLSLGAARRPTWPGQLLELMVVVVVSSHS